MKLPAPGAALLGKVISFYIVPLAPVYNAGLAGHALVSSSTHKEGGNEKDNLVGSFDRGFGV